MNWFKGKKRYKQLLALAAVAVIVGLLRGAAAEAGAEIYTSLRSMYS
ncbi:hypothetical protein [Streptomyces globisporus]